jgi:hypothetical protein
LNVSEPAATAQDISEWFFILRSGQLHRAMVCCED